MVLKRCRLINTLLHYLNAYISLQPRENMIPIEEVRVYDPQIHGHTHQTLNNLTDTDQQKLRIILYDRISNSRVENQTLEEYLHGRQGYFERNPTTFQVVFLNGRFHSAQTFEEYYKIDLENIAQTSQAIPLFFSREVEVDDFPTQRDSRQVLISTLSQKLRSPREALTLPV